MSAERRSRYLRVVRPGSGAGSEAAALPPLPVEPPLTPPLWLEPPRTAAPAPGAPTPGAPGAVPVQGPAHGVGFAGATFTSDGDDTDPLGAALRERLHQAVGEVRPAPDSLTRLRRAVPQRRTLRRRAYGGAAVAASLALFGLTALHSLGPDGSTSADTGPAGQLLPGAHPSATGDGLSGAASGPAFPGGTLAGSADATRGHRPGTVLVPLPSGGVTSIAASQTHVGVSPALAECTRGQLGKGAAGVAPPDASGIVYGSFAVSNVSSKPCKISSSGTIDVLSAVRTQTSQFAVVPHTAGDPAVALPTPDPSHPPVELGPGQTYVVDFAFVPASCASGSSVGPTDAASPTSATPGSSSGATGGTSGSGASAAADGASGGAPGSPTSSPGTPGGSGGSGGTGGSASPDAPSVQVASVPAAGGRAAATTTLQDACAGTIYRTDPLPAPH
ncbi:hypothetical protein [Streptacidiphilus neutrinimicus]|uniref:hypothetical protein n=1 Tax=Streptacidiphilus neutrinimicus TaxID=105420 RepID=UPI0005A840CE|nr:hypothetical protein [Streptacidiphilus neutrinimicus]